MKNDLDLIKENMTSLELAEFSDRRHDHLIRDIDKIFKNAGIDPLDFEEFYEDSAKREQKCYNLGKSEILLITSKFDNELYMKVIKRLEKLAKQNEDYSKQLLYVTEQNLQTTQKSLTHMNKSYKTVKNLLFTQKEVNMNYLDVEYKEVFVKLFGEKTSMGIHDKEHEKAIRAFVKYLVVRYGDNEYNVEDESMISLYKNEVLKAFVED